ncbi:homeobox and leucine zipper encoding a [Eucyclogobius newberryi]|uniref:homeobox and leucine zipper encoding a n=1 Tax=Eucyclogobius newberryi TaxID=166745 RepID=UPI003B5A3B9C
MEIYNKINSNGAQPVNLKSPLKVKGMRCIIEGNDKAKSDSRYKCGTVENGMASFTTNTNSAVCLPLVSEGLKLVWTQSDQTSELDSIPELVQAFNLFPYPSSREVNLLAKVCVLPLDKVKVWFMVQRIKYGISWSSEEIEETRRKLSVPELYNDSSETPGKEQEISNKGKNCTDTVVDGKVEESLVANPKKRSRCESPDSYKSAKPSAPCFSSSLPPPQDSYYYHPPEDKQEPQSEPTLSISETHSQQNRHSRYRKSKSQLASLRKSFLRENWPSEGELRRLQEETGLTRNDIRKWFSDSRYQLRVGRGTLAAAQGFSHNSAASLASLKPDTMDQSLPLVSKKHNEPNGASVDEEPQNNGMGNSEFFQNFLSNSLEAFRDKTDDESEELSRDSEDDIKEEQEQPLQLTKQCKAETDVLWEPSNLKISSKSPPPGSPTPSFSPVKRPSNSITTSKKSVHSTKASPSQTLLNASMASTSSSLTPAGRPRKTKEQLDALKQYFLRCQWPKGEDYTELVKLTALPRADIIQWFGDTRYAVKNGQLRWVKGVRDQFLAELSAQQNVVNNVSSPRIGAGHKQKSAFPDIQPLVTYYHTTGLLQEKDLDSLCKKSKMSYQQVRDWFAAQDSPDQTVAME